MDKFDFERAAHELALLYVWNKVQESDDLVDYCNRYLNAYHQFHGYLKSELSSRSKDD